MNEKIKINVTSYLYRIIQYDALRFGFKDDNFKINYNLLLNTIIKNYYQFYKDIKGKYYYIFQNDSLLFHNLITSYILKNNDNDEPLDYSFTIRPTKQTINTFIDIEQNELAKISLSNFIRNMLIQFSSLKIYEKEKLLFIEKYDEINLAIKSKKRLFIITKNSEFYFDCLKMCQSPDDEHNYLIGKIYFDSNTTLGCIKLSTIKNLATTSYNLNITDDEINIIKTTIPKGIQFIGQNPVTAKIKFTDGGLKMYDKCYNDRPIYVSFDKENNIMIFNNSIDHLFIYLKQFGRHAIVLEPVELRDRLKDFFKKANTEYNI